MNSGARERHAREKKGEATRALQMKCKCPSLRACASAPLRARFVKRAESDTQDPAQRPKRLSTTVATLAFFQFAASHAEGASVRFHFTACRDNNTNLGAHARPAEVVPRKNAERK